MHVTQAPYATVPGKPLVWQIMHVGRTVSWELGAGPPTIDR